MQEQRDGLYLTAEEEWLILERLRQAMLDPGRHWDDSGDLASAGRILLGLRAPPAVDRRAAGEG